MSKETNRKLSDEFKNEIKEERKRKNIFGTILAFLAVVLIFGTIGIALYQLLMKPETVENKSASEKIISKPTEDKKEPVKEEVPAATTPAPTPTPAATTPAPTATSTDYTVVAGDTWSSIANANGMSSAKLMEYNGASSEDLQIGQVIKIPKS